MKLGKPINIRSSIESEAMYEAEAWARNIPLRTYLRQRLEGSDDIAEEISILRHILEQSTTLSQKNSRGDGANAQRLSLLLEMLLLLRQTAQPHKVQLAQQELRRLGFEIWSLEENDES